MAILFYIVGVASVLYGIFVSTLAKSAIHEIEAFVVFLIAAILIVGGTIVDQLHRLLAKVESRQGVSTEEAE